MDWQTTDTLPNRFEDVIVWHRDGFFTEGYHAGVKRSPTDKGPFWICRGRPFQEEEITYWMRIQPPEPKDPTYKPYKIPFG